MVRLHALGRVDLAGPDGTEPGIVLSQPKPLAVLIYLALARHSSFGRRDELLALFWPEMTTARGRRALSQALHVLRSSLGPAVIEARGTEELRVSPEGLWCDATEFRQLLDEGRLEEAMNLYTGDLLPGFFAGDASGFEDWVSRERSALRDMAAATAWLLSESEGDHRSSAWARRAVELSPFDEGGVRRLMNVLDRGGDRAGAIRVYNELSARLERDLAVEPSAETTAAVTRIRTRAEVPLSSKEPGRALSASKTERDPLKVDSTSTTHLSDSLRQPETLPDIPHGRRRNAFPVAVAVAAVVTVFLAIFFRGEAADGRSRNVATIVEPKERVLVAQFGSAPQDSALASFVTEAVRLDLSQSSLVRIVSGPEVRDALRLMRRDTTLRPDQGIAREIAERAGVKAVLEGDVRRSGSVFILSARLVNAGTGELVEGWRSSASDSAAIVVAVDQLTRKFRQRVGESLQSIQASSPLLKLTTSSLPALRKHAMAMSAFYEEDYSRAAALYEEAIALDTTFADAYVSLVGALGQLDLKPARQIEATILAYRYRHQLADVERYGVEGNYLARVTGDLNGAIDAYMNQAKLDPRIAFWGSLGSLLIRAKRPQDAERMLSGALKSVPTPIMYYHLAHARHLQGKTTAARATLDSGAARFPNHSIFGRTRIEIEAAARDYAAADSMVHAVSSPRPAAYPVRHQALIDAVREKLPESFEHLRLLRARQLSTGSVRASFGTFLLLQRLVLHASGDTASALREVEGALSRREFHALDVRERPYASLSHFFVEAGKPARAEQLVREYEEKVPSEFRMHDRALLVRTKAMLDVARGRRHDAVQALRAAAEHDLYPHGPLADLAWAYERIGALDSTAAVYARYVETSSLRRFEEDAFYLRHALRSLERANRSKGKSR